MKSTHLIDASNLVIDGLNLHSINSQSETTRVIDAAPALRLNATDSAARILHRLYIGKGFCAGPDFPGNTIRKAFAKLEKVGALAVINQRFAITSAGRDWLHANHLNIRD